MTDYSKRTPGQWEVGAIPNNASDGSTVRRIESVNKGQSMRTLCDVYGLNQEEADANAAHIAACWNACEGINPEAVPEIIEALAKLEEIVSDDLRNQSEQDTPNYYEIKSAAESARKAIKEAKRV